MFDALEKLDQRPETDWRACCLDLTEEQTAEVGRFAAGEYDVVLGMLERRVDGQATRRSQVRTSVAEILRAKESRPAPIHSALIHLADRGNAVSIVTTNFDRLLEKAGERLKPRPTTYSLGAIPRPTERGEFSGVFHIHGALPRNPRQTSDLVVTDQDFGDFYLRRRVVPDFIYDAARLYHLVLVGYSANDPPMCGTCSMLSRRMGFTSATSRSASSSWAESVRSGRTRGVACAWHFSGRVRLGGQSPATPQ